MVDYVCLAKARCPQISVVLIFVAHLRWTFGHLLASKLNLASLTASLIDCAFVTIITMNCSLLDHTLIQSLLRFHLLLFALDRCESG